MNCPVCKNSQLVCIDSREYSGNKRRRRHKCQSCGNRFTTIEMIVDSDILGCPELDDINETIRLSRLAKKGIPDDSAKIAALAKKFAYTVLKECKK